MTTWFTADLHLGHNNIIRFCERPFASAEEMDAALIANWRAVVAPKDDVWVLGDFCYRSAVSPESYLSRLPGRKHLVTGNHDKEATLTAPGWASVQPFAETVVEGTKIALLHYGMRTWRNSRHGALHLYGHSHGNLPGFQTPGGGGCLDVGVDCWGFTPAKLSDIKERIATLPVVGQEDGEADDE